MDPANLVQSVNLAWIDRRAEVVSETKVSSGSVLLAAVKGGKARGVPSAVWRVPEEERLRPRG